MSAEETAVRTAKPKSVHGKMIRLARPYWFSYVLLGAAIFLSAWIPVGHAEGIRRVFNAVMDRSFDQLWLAAVFYGAVMLFGLVLGIVIEWGKQALNNRTTLDMQREVMGRLLRMPLMRFHQWHTGDKLQRLNDSAIAVQQGLNAQIPFYIEKLLSLVLLMGYLSILSWELLAGSMAIAIGVPLLGNLFAGPLHRWQSKFNESQSRQNADLQEQFQAMEVVKFMVCAPFFCPGGNRESRIPSRPPSACTCTISPRESRYSWAIGSASSTCSALEHGWPGRTGSKSA